MTTAKNLFKKLPMTILGFCLFVYSCTGQNLEVRTLRVGPASFQTEIAATPEARQQGLMGRKDLGDHQAMLFVFPNEEPQIFWMKDTPSPLSIAYINKQGVVKEILDMQPFSLAPVPSRYAVLYALEVPQGAFARLGVKVGDVMFLEDLKGLSAGR